LERDSTHSFLMAQYGRHGAHGVSDLLTSTTCDRTFVSERLMPLYTGSYKYQGKIYNFIISGITGDVFGEYPVSQIMSKMKSLAGIGKFILTLLGLIAVLWFLSLKQQEMQSRGYQ